MKPIGPQKAVIVPASSGVERNNRLRERRIFSPIAVSYTHLVADGVLFLLGAAVMGKAFAATIILSTIVYPTFFSLFKRYWQVLWSRDLGNI